MIRLINEDDLPKLRQWKNDHKEVFFHKDEISEEQQNEWYREYQKKEDDFMFMVFWGKVPIGCIAVRLIDKVWDVYNLILGLPEYGGKGLMSEALKDVIDFTVLCNHKTITCKVLKDNLAIYWYGKNGFMVTSEYPDHYVMTYRGKA